MKLDDKFTCTSCDKEDTCNTDLDTKEGKIMNRDTVCFTCAFWLNKIENPNPNRAIVEGRHYVIEPGQQERRMFLGSGGVKLTVRYLDGREVYTNSLWQQGDIPKQFKDRLPDNATFIYSPSPEVA